MRISESLALKIPDRFMPTLRILLRYQRLLRYRCLLGYRRLLRYQHLLTRKPVEEYTDFFSQQRLLRENYSPDIEKLIVFLTPGYDFVGGGVLAISSIYEETKKLKHIHEGEVIMCTQPGHPPLIRYTKFENQNYIYRFSQVLSYFQNLRNLMIHIPEYCVGQFQQNISNEDRLRLTKIKNVNVNIMIMNIVKLESLVPMEYINELKQFGKLTCTTAHEQYSTLKLREKLGIPLHKLSVFVSPEQYSKKTYVEKENLMIVSPDQHKNKWKILKLLVKQFPQLRIQIIRDLTYAEYKDVISQAKWALTFGEGLDGYFVETIFSGGVSFSVYNREFFTEEFGSLHTVYENYEIMFEKLCSDIKDLDNEINYTGYQNKQYDLCCKYYDYKQYVNNLELFYKGQYTYE